VFSALCARKVSQSICNFVSTVKATNGVGDSVYSSTFVATSYDVPATPAAPTVNVAATYTGVTIAYVEPALNGGALVKYIVKLELSADVGYGADIDAGTATTNALSSLTPDSSYDVIGRWCGCSCHSFICVLAMHSAHANLTINLQLHTTPVICENSLGESAVSPPLTFSTLTPTVSATPAAPTISVAADQTTVTVAYVQPVLNGATLVKYNLQVATQASNTFGSAIDASTATSFQLTGLTAGTAYFVKVSCLNTVGEISCKCLFL
jgi:hypothetical protein